MRGRGWAWIALAAAFLVAPASAYADDPPSCDPMDFGIFQNQVVNLAFQCSDDATPSRNLVYSDIKAQHGTVAGTSNTYQPDLDWNGTDIVSSTASGAVTPPVASSAPVVGTPVDSAPRATAAHADARRGNALDVAAPGVLANDVGPDGQTLTAVVVGGARHGTVALKPDG